MPSLLVKRAFNVKCCVVGLALLLLALSGRGALADERSESYRAHAQWKRDLIRTLQHAGDADSLLAAMLIAGESRERSQAAINQMYAVGQSNPKVLFATALSVACNPTPMASNAYCDRSLRAAKALAHTDADNSMAWLTLAFMADQANVASSEVDKALKRAATAPRVHDYGFDLVKVAVMATARLPISAEALPLLVGRRMSVEDARLEGIGMEAFGSMTAVTPLLQWVIGGCSNNARTAPESERGRLCVKAKELFKRGDSQVTLSANPEALKAISANFEFVRRKKDLPESEPKTRASDVNYSKAMIETYAVAANECELLQKLAARLASAQGQ